MQEWKQKKCGQNRKESKRKSQCEYWAAAFGERGAVTSAGVVISGESGGGKGGKGPGTATGTLTGAVSTTMGLASAAGEVCQCSIAGILGGLAALLVTALAAGTLTSLRGATGRTAAAAPIVRRAAAAANWFFSSSLKA